MPMGPDCSELVLLELEMMDQSKNWLEEQEAEDSDADDRVVVVETDGHVVY